MKKFLVMSPSVSHSDRYQLEIYELNEDGTWYMRVDSTDGTGYKVEKIQKYPNYGWKFFDSLEECQTYISEFHWKIKNGSWVTNPSVTPHAVCPKCSKGWLFNIPTDCDGNEIFVEEDYLHRRCYCGEKISVRMNMSVTFTQV